MEIFCGAKTIQYFSKVGREICKLNADEKAYIIYNNSKQSTDFIRKNISCIDFDGKPVQITNKVKTPTPRSISETSKHDEEKPPEPNNKPPSEEKKEEKNPN